MATAQNFFIKRGSTSNILQISIGASNVTTDAGLTGLAFNTASLTAYYHADSATTATAISLVTMTVGTFTSSGFKEIDATNMPGMYQLGIPDAAVATGNNVIVVLQGAATMQQTRLQIKLDAVASDLISIDGSLTSGNNATLHLKKLNIINSSGDAFVAQATGSNGNGFSLAGNGSGMGLYAVGGTTGNGIWALGGNTSGSGLVAEAATSGQGFYGVGSGAGGCGILASGGTNAAGFYAFGAGTQPGILAQGGLTGNGIGAVGGATSGSGFYTYAVGGGPGVTAIGVGTVSILATQGISGPLDASEKNSIADALLKRDMSAVTGEASRSFLNCLRIIRNKWSISSSTLTVTKEDDATPAWTATLSTDATAVPIVGFDGS